MMQLTQSENGYRFSIDAFLLAAFTVRFNPTFFLDMGAGSGVVSWQMKQLMPEIRGVAVEIQAEFLPFARKNLKDSGVTLVHADIRELSAPHTPFDLLVSNPPYFRVGHGKLSKNPVKAAARHMLNGTLSEWVSHAGKFLVENGGVCVVYPSRYAMMLIKEMRLIGFYVNELVHVCSYQGQAPKLVCLYFSRDERDGKEETLVLYQGHRQRTPEAIKFLSGTLQETNFL